MKPARRHLRWSLLLVLGLGLALLYAYLEPGRWLTLEGLQARRDELLAWRAAHPALAATTYFALYVLVAALSIPGATVLTLAGGAVFGLGWGLLLVSFASSVGALLAFWAARYWLREIVQRRFGRWLAPINTGLAESGTWYLLTLRLVPIFPFWLVNLLMGLSTLGWRRYYGVSQIGMLPGTVVYVNAGTQLATITRMADILSPAILGSLALLGLFPLLAKAGVALLQRRRVYAGWPRPKRFDRNLIVVGAGAGGLVSAYLAAAVRAKVTLIESHAMGGDCLNTGCVPSKALIRSARAARQARELAPLGLNAPAAQVDFAAVMARVHAVIARIAPHDSVARYTQLGVEVLQGQAHLLSPWSVEITQADGSRQTLSARQIVLATGASPTVPDLPGLQGAPWYTSDTLWRLPELPTRLIVLGGGPVGCELAQCFAQLGSQVTLIERGGQLLAREDPEVAETVVAGLRRDGVRVLTGHQALRITPTDGVSHLVVTQGGRELTLPFDALLCAVGRTPRVTGFGLEALGITLRPDQTIATNAYLQTRYPNIYAVGDVTGPFQLTHAAAHQAWYAVVNALFGRFKTFKVDYRHIPWATFTEPEVARVGLSETEAKRRGIAHEVTRYALEDLDRAIADGTTQGFIKVLTAPGRDTLLGVTIVGAQAGELLAEYVLAMKHGLGLNKILSTPHIYPTLAEVNKQVAGVWKRQHAPQRLLRWVARYHAWERS